MLKRFIIVLLVAGSIFTSCGDNIDRADQILSKDTLPDLFAKNIEILYSDSGLVRMKLFAGELNDYSQADTPYTEFPKGVTVFLYNKKNVRESYLQAGYAIYDQRKDLWTYKKKVKLENKEGKKLETEVLIADRKEETLSSDKYVRVTEPEGYILEGVGFDSNFEFTDYNFRDISTDNE